MLPVTAVVAHSFGCDLCAAMEVCGFRVKAIFWAYGFRLDDLPIKRAINSSTSSAVCTDAAPASDSRQARESNSMSVKQAPQAQWLCSYSSRIDGLPDWPKMR